MNEKDVMNAVKTFIEKSNAPLGPKVEWPPMGFKIKSVSSVEINEEPLEKFEGLWTFKGTADIVKTDERATVPTISSYEIIGSTKFVCHINPTDGRLIPDVKEVTITKATPIIKSRA